MLLLIAFNYGTGSAMQDIGHALEWKGKGRLGSKMGRMGEDISKGHLVEPISPEMERELGAKVFLKPQYWATNIAQSLPVEAALMAPAIGAGVAGAAASGPAALLTGAAAGAAASRSGESFLEAGQAHGEALKLGYDRDTAEKIADTVYKENLKLTAVDIPELALLFAPVPQGVKKMATTPIKKALTGAGTAVGKIGGAAAQRVYSDQCSGQGPGRRKAWLY